MFFSLPLKFTLPYEMPFYQNPVVYCNTYICTNTCRFKYNTYNMTLTHIVCVCLSCGCFVLYIYMTFIDTYKCSKSKFIINVQCITRKFILVAATIKQKCIYFNWANHCIKLNIYYSLHDIRVWLTSKFAILHDSNKIQILVEWHKESMPSSACE